MERERLKSRLGFILISAGCAIGVGNVWKFPWLAGQNGGGAFVVIYLIFLIILGLPTLTIEFSLGRASQKSPVKMYDTLAPKKSFWFLNGYVSLLGNIILMMFYTVVSGWMLYYFYSMVIGRFEKADLNYVSNYFSDMCNSPTIMTIFMVIIVVLGFFIISKSLQSGLEFVTKKMMILLFVIMLVLVIHSLMLSGAQEGLKFYLLPDFSKVNSNVIVAAMNQSFFTLSLGIGAMAIFGSYIDKDYTLMTESKNVIILDTSVAIMAGLIIFPACYTYGIEPDAGPKLIFVTLPNIFANMTLGRLWGSLFFLFMTFAAFSTVLAVFENIVACTRELTGWKRKKTCIIWTIGMIILSLPCALGFNLWSNINPLGVGTNIMDLEDFIVSNCILPLGSLIFVLFATSKFGWGFENFKAEANMGKGLKVVDAMRFYMTYILPLIIIAIFIIGIIPYIVK